MTSRRRKRFSWRTASRDWMIATLYWGRAIAARMPMMATTVISSIRVKPAPPLPSSPGVVDRPIERLALALRVDVVDVVPAPRRAVRRVLVASHTPFRAARHGIAGDPPEELELAVEGAHAVHALDQRLQLGRIALAPQLDVGPADLPLLHRELVAVDREPHLAEGPPQLQLPLADDRHPPQGQDGGSQDDQDGRGGDQLQVGHASAPPVSHGAPPERPWPAACPGGRSTARPAGWGSPWRTRPSGRCDRWSGSVASARPGPGTRRAGRRIPRPRPRSRPASGPPPGPPCTGRLACWP